MAQRNGRTEVVLQGTRVLTGFDPRTGDKLWEVEDDGLFPIPSPVVAGDLVLAASRGMIAVKPAANGGAGRVEIDQAGSGTPSPLVVDGRVYTLRGDILVCGDIADGKVSGISGSKGRSRLRLSMPTEDLRGQQGRAHGPNGGEMPEPSVDDNRAALVSRCGAGGGALGVGTGIGVAVADGAATGGGPVRRVRVRPAGEPRAVSGMQPRVRRVGNRGGGGAMAQSPAAEFRWRRELRPVWLAIVMLWVGVGGWPSFRRAGRDAQRMSGSTRHDDDIETATAAARRDPQRRAGEAGRGIDAGAALGREEMGEAFYDAVHNNTQPDVALVLANHGADLTVHGGSACRRRCRCITSTWRGGWSNWGRT